jgi:hypothetical protein
MTLATWSLTSGKVKARIVDQTRLSAATATLESPPLERQREFDPVATDHRSRCLADAVGVAFLSGAQFQGHEFQFEFLADRPLVSAGKSPGSPALEARRYRRYLCRS